MRNLISITDFSIGEIDEMITLAGDIMDNPLKYEKVCQGKILATLFFEPSTRTRLSFESAMLSLGGNVLGFSEANSSSSAKGESVSDTVRVVGEYSDIIAMRHPREGAPMLASEKSVVPIINVGDGGYFHPTQTLTDLLTISREKGRLSNMTIGLCGDLCFGRTVHSLIEAMMRYENVDFVLISPDELRLPKYMREKIKEAGVKIREFQKLEDGISQLDILYMTRIQRERFFNEEEYLRLKGTYVLNSEKLKNAKSDMKILHPLPRVDEISTDVDDDPRAKYFEQARCGRFIRMALIMKLLGIDKEGKE